MLGEFTLLCAATFIAGYSLTWLLYKSRRKSLRGSSIQTKIHTWIPIFSMVLLASMGNGLVSVGIFLLTIMFIFYDYFRRRSLLRALPFAPIHTLIVVVGVAGLFSLAANDTEMFLGIWYMALLSDVTAFFFGNVLGKHRLPDALNSHKSWEGVAGQLVGAMLGYVAVSAIIDVPVWLALIVGIGAALGDLCNSFVKRKGGFKDWSNTLPGHGGFIDRLCSLGYGSLLVTFVILVRTWPSQLGA